MNKKLKQIIGTGRVLLATSHAISAQNLDTSQITPVQNKDYKLSMKDKIVYGSSIIGCSMLVLGGIHVGITKFTKKYE